MASRTGPAFRKQPGRSLLRLGLFAFGAMAGAPAQEVSEIMPLAEETLILDIAAAGDREVAVGHRGHILLSNDFGSTWTQVQAPTRELLTGVSFADRNRGVAVGHHNVVLLTTDGGYTWKLSRIEAEFDVIFLDVLLLNNREGFAIGAYGEFWQTADGGLNWEQNFINEDELHLNAIVLGGDGTLYIAGESGTLLRSDDRGANWEPLESPYFGSFHGILAAGTSDVFVYGLRGHLYHSRDRGETWTDKSLPLPVMVSAGAVIDNDRLVLAGQGGNFFFSDDGGASFRFLRLIEYENVVQLHADHKRGLIVGGNKGVAHITPAQLNRYFREAGPFDSVLAGR